MLGLLKSSYRRKTFEHRTTYSNDNHKKHRKRKLVGFSNLLMNNRVDAGGRSEEDGSKESKKSRVPKSITRIVSFCLKDSALEVLET